MRLLPQLLHTSADWSWSLCNRIIITNLCPLKGNNNLRCPHNPPRSFCIKVPRSHATTLYQPFNLNLTPAMMFLPHLKNNFHRYHSRLAPLR